MSEPQKPNKQDRFPIPELKERADKCGNRLLESDKIHLATHNDADGIAAGAIAVQALERAGLEFEVSFHKQLDESEIASIAETNPDVALFTDFGSGQLDIITQFESDGAFTPVIVDHHEPADEDTEYHLNPILFGISGSSELSGAGATYALARAVSHLQCERGDVPSPPKNMNTDLAGLAIVGAVGDMQTGENGLSGTNEEIVAEGVENGVVQTKQDISLYGKQTRSVPKLLEFSTDIRIPGITGSESGTIEFLHELNIDLTNDEGEWKHWTDLTDDEKQNITSGLINKAIQNDVPTNRIDDLVTETYILTDEPERTHLRDVGEFSTLLNSTGRYEKYDVGLAVCLGERGDAYTSAKTLLKQHQENISKGIDWVSTEGVTKESHIQWFNAGNKIRETIVGIIAGMALGEGNIDQHTPIIAFAEKQQEDDSTEEETPKELKISSRATRKLTAQGLDLSVVMEKASKHVGGDGGGHDIAAGATIPADKQSEFLSEANSIVKEQTA